MGDEKYSAAHRAFSEALKRVNLKCEGLGAVAADIQQHGFPDARPIDGYQIDFGDGQGPIDVIAVFAVDDIVVRGYRVIRDW